MQGPMCPLPLTHDDQIVIGHGSGGRMTADLIERIFYPPFDNPTLLVGDDSAILELSGAGCIAVSIDSHVVSPLIFPGGDIGSLAICGTVNDLAMVGATPRWLTASFILEEGLHLETLERILKSMKAAALEAGITIVAGDTKVAERGKADQIFITTSGIGVIPEGRNVSGRNARVGDAVLVSGPIGDHGIAVLAARGQLDFDAQVQSDIAPLCGLTEGLFEHGLDIHVMRDPTRGGLATTLNEIARQSDVLIELNEERIPVRPAVEAACEMLGFDPLYVPNEGKFITILPEDDAETALAVMHDLPYGEGACRIGHVGESPSGRVLMRTAIGGTRVVDVLAGEMLPRIC